jgi:hypothetical protein
VWFLRKPLGFYENRRDFLFFSWFSELWWIFRTRSFKFLNNVLTKNLKIDSNFLELFYFKISQMFENFKFNRPITSAQPLIRGPSTYLHPGAFVSEGHFSMLKPGQLMLSGLDLDRGYTYKLPPEFPMSHGLGLNVFWHVGTMFGTSLKHDKQIRSLVVQGAFNRLNKFSRAQDSVSLSSVSKFYRNIHRPGRFIVLKWFLWALLSWFVITRMSASMWMYICVVYIGTCGYMRHIYWCNAEVQL